MKLFDKLFNRETIWFVWKDKPKQLEIVKYDRNKLKKIILNDELAVYYFNKLQNSSIRHGKAINSDTFHKTFLNFIINK